VTVFISAAFASEAEPLSIKKCKSCHGEDFEKKAFGKATVLKGQKVDALETSLFLYQNGKQNKTGFGVAMTGQVKGFSAEEIKTIAKYIAQYKAPTNQEQSLFSEKTHTHNTLLSLSECWVCHGKNFEKSALNKSDIVKGQSANAIEASLNGYKAGTLGKDGTGKAGLGLLMQRQVKNYSAEEIKSIATYISNIK